MPHPGLQAPRLVRASTEGLRNFLHQRLHSPKNTVLGDLEVFMNSGQVQKIVSGKERMDY